MNLPSGASQFPFSWRVVGWLLYRLERMGISIKPYLIVREGVVAPPAAITLDSKFSSGFAGPKDSSEIVRVEPGITAELCADRFRQGLLCFAVKEGSRIVAKMWCDLGAFNFPPSHRKLDGHEAYLFNAYVDPNVRGRNLAPFMRQECYAALRAIGRDSYFSYSDFFNIASRRFKKKLGAVDESLCVSITIRDRFSRTFTLRRYSS
jgi:hypothetical protein